MKRPFADKRPIGPFAQALPGLPEIVGVYDLPDSADKDIEEKVERVPSIENAEYRPDGDLEVTFRHTKGTAADTRGKGIDVMSVVAVKTQIEKEYDTELEYYDIELFSIPQQRVMNR